MGTGWVDNLQGMTWAICLVVVVVVAFDAVLPVLPGETTAVAAVSLVAPDFWPIVAVGVATALGAFLGDVACFLIGRRWGQSVVDWLPRGRTLHRTRAKLHDAVQWARKELDERGPRVIVPGRFVPLGRTAISLTAGTTDMPTRRFLGAVSISGPLWALYVTVIGVVGGTAFENTPLLGVVVSVTLGILLGIAYEAVTRLVRNRRATGRAERDTEPEEDAPTGAESRRG
jgi:membrane-associated protein